VAREGPLEEMTNSANAGLPDKAREATNEALHGGIDSMTAIKQELKPGMDSAGEAFPRGTCSSLIWCWLARRLKQPSPTRNLLGRCRGAGAQGSVSEGNG